MLISVERDGEISLIEEYNDVLVERLSTVDDVDRLIQQLINAKNKIYGENSSSILLNVKGPSAKEVEKDFWAWFLDGGGAYSFCDSVQPDDEYSFKLEYNENNKRWFIESEGK